MDAIMMHHKMISMTIGNCGMKMFGYGAGVQMRKMMKYASVFLVAGGLASADAQAGDWFDWFGKYDLGWTTKVEPQQATVCSAAVLKGTYIYALRGVLPDGRAYAEAGVEQYDGAGTVTATATASTTGKRETDKGTYDVGSDCTGNVTYSNGGTYDIYLARNGERFSFVNTRSGYAISGETVRAASE